MDCQTCGAKPATKVTAWRSSQMATSAYLYECTEDAERSAATFGSHVVYVRDLTPEPSPTH